MTTRTVRLPLPVDLRPTMAPLRVGASDPTVRLTADEMLRASHTPEGPVTLHVRVTGDVAAIEAWGVGADWALQHAPDLVGATDDLTGFDAGLHPVVARCARRAPGVRMIRSGLVTDVLVQTILGQKVTGLEAKRSWAWMVRRLGRPAPGPGDMLVPPTAERLAAAAYWELHEAGVERTRAVTIIEACRRIDRLQEAATMGPAESRARLTAVGGIGDWTAAIIARVAFGDADAVETGDYHLPNTIGWNLAGEERADDHRMLELLAPFAPHRGRTLRLIEVAGQPAPRHAPRMPPSQVM